MNRPVLEREQEQLFIELVEASRSRPRPDREPFFLMQVGGRAFVKGNGYGEQVPEEDIHVLANADLLQIMEYTQSGFKFMIPPTALQYYEELKRSSSEPLEQVEGEVIRYLDAASFQALYPDAYARWRDAARLVWHADSAGELSTIGHKCREAVQEFLTALLDRLGVQGANPDRAATRERFSAVLNARRGQLGEAKYELLDALFNYWRAVCDLVQRQEHAGQREGESLVWEDGRRVVFQTANVIVEIARSL